MIASMISNDIVDLSKNKFKDYDKIIVLSQDIIIFHRVDYYVSDSNVRY